ncbi:MAG: dimethylsulfoniopropionate demethylase [Pseudomonadota bacterium]
MLQLSAGSRLRVSPFHSAALAAGVTHVTVYNHMLMPTAFGDPEAEYWRLINGVSLWDVAVERQVEISGPDAGACVQRLCARDLTNCEIGKGKYVPICDHRGTLINDPVLLRLEDDRYWLSIADADLLLWARAVAGEQKMDVSIFEPDVSPLAIQGPKAEDVVAAVCGDWVRDLKLFWFKPAEINGIPVIVARSGWSKQGGFEIYLQDGARGQELWNMVWQAGEDYDIGPGGPNAIERVESGLLSYGADTDDHTNPFECGMGRYVSTDTDADYIGKSALKTVADEGPSRQRVGIFVDGDRLQPSDRKWTIIQDGEPVGFAGSVVYSPRLERNIGVAQVSTPTSEIGTQLNIYTPDGLRAAEVTTLPFL